MGCKLPILVTGAHRSGTTWVGRMVALSKEVGYIHEPFNVEYGWQAGFSVSRWFMHLDKTSDSVYGDAYRRLLRHDSKLLPKLARVRSLGGLVHIMRGTQRSRRYARENRRALVKDPLALLSAEWLAKLFDMKVVVMIRHPAAFVGSLKKAQWRHPFEDFMELKESRLEWFEDFHDSIQRAYLGELDPIDEGILLWNITHRAIQHYYTKYSEWFFVRHEDLSVEPLSNFEAIYQYLGLDYTSQINDQILMFTNDNKKGDSYERHEVRRNSQANVKSWKSRLSLDEVNRIYDGTKSVASGFYNDDSWT